MSQSRLTIVPLTVRAANAVIENLHRHHPPVRGHVFSVGVVDEDGEMRGVCTVGRPVARGLQDGLTAEVTRVATDGCPNACSALYGAARRAAKALGYRRLLTYTLASEPGTSLRAAGWTQTSHVKGRSWSCPSRPREDRSLIEDKVRWEASL